MRRHLTAASLLAALVVQAPSALGAAPDQPLSAAGSIGVRLVGAPAGSRDARGRSYIIERVAPGATIRRRVEISNDTPSTAEVAVYAAAAGLRRGTFEFAPGHGQNELSGWTSVSRSVLRLPSGTRALETVTIKVPRKASSGERYAVIWAEIAAAAPVAGGVRLVNRVGIRTYLSVGPGGVPRSDFAIGELGAKRSPGGDPLVVAKVRNTGGSALDIAGTLTLSRGPGALRAGPFPITLERALSPNGSQTMKVVLDRQLPSGPWRVHVRLKSGLIERLASATITFPPRAGRPSAAEDTSESARLDLGVPLVVALLTAPCLLWLVRRGRRGRDDGEPVVTDPDRERGSFAPR